MTPRRGRKDVEEHSRLDVVAFIDPSVAPHPSAHDSARPRFGAFRAQWSLLKALASQTDSVALTLVSTPEGEKRLDESARHWLGAPVRTINYLQLPTLTIDSSRTIIHHVGQVFDQAPYAIRSALGRRIPVTSNHHSLGYSHLLQAASVLNRVEAQPKDAIIASSPHARQVLEWMIDAAAPEWPGSIPVIPLPVEGRPPTIPERVAARERFGLRPDDITILSLGRLSRSDKATLEPLLWSFAEICQGTGAAARLMIVGDDSSGYAAELSREAQLFGIAERVQILADVDDDVRTQSLWAADIFVGLFDSHQEAFGLTVGEAQMAGLPCLVSDYSGVGTLIRDGVTGIALPTTHLRSDRLEDMWRHLLTWEADHLHHAQLVRVDRRALSNGLRALVEHPEHRRRTATAAREHALTQFAPRSIAEQYVSLWRRGGERTPADRFPTGEPSARESRVGPFQSFASQVLDPSMYLVAWQPHQRFKVTDLIDNVISDLPGAGVIERCARVLASNGSYVQPHELAQAAGVSDDATLLAIAILSKYGYVEFIPRGSPGCGGGPIDRRLLT